MGGLTQDSQVAKTAGEPASHQEASAERTYRNESLGLSYRLPEGYSPNRGAIKQFVPGPWTRPLLVADQNSTGKPCINRLVVVTADTRNFASTSGTKSLTLELLREITKNSDVKLTSGTYQVRLAGKVFYRIDYRKKLGCGVLRQSLLTVKVRHSWCAGLLDASRKRNSINWWTHSVPFHLRIEFEIDLSGCARVSPACTDRGADCSATKRETSVNYEDMHNHKLA